MAFGNGYSYRRAITIDHTKVGAPISTLSRAAWSATADSQYDATVPPSEAIICPQTKWWLSAATFPHYIAVDMGSAQTFNRVVVDELCDTVARRTLTWELYVSDDGSSWGSAVASGNWTSAPTGTIYGVKVISFSAVTKRYFKFVGLTGGQTYMNIRQITAEYADAAGSHANFPLLISGTYDYLAHTDHGGKLTSASGFDLIFTSDEEGNTKLDHQIESYNHETGALVFWVRVPTLSAADGTVVYAFYGNSSVTTSQQDVPGVWNSNFKAVYHLGNGVTLNVADSTSNAQDLTNNNATPAAGQVDGGAGFSGSAQYIYRNNPTGFPTGAAERTLSAWFKLGADGPVSIGGWGIAWALWHQSGYLGLEADAYDPLFPWTYDTGWHRLAAVLPAWDNRLSGVLFYLDGVYTPTTALVANSIVNTAAGTAAFGALPRSLNSNNLTGQLDEVRISDIARDGGWLLTEFNSEASPSTFYGVGDEATGSKAYNAVFFLGA